MNVSEALKLVTEEYNRANGAHPMFNSAHEGYAVMLAEVEDLWDEIKHDNVGRFTPEAVQVAAMALKFLVSCCGVQTLGCHCPITGPTYQGSGNHKGITMCQLCGRPARLGK